MRGLKAQSQREDVGAGKLPAKPQLRLADNGDQAESGSPVHDLHRRVEEGVGQRRWSARKTIFFAGSVSALLWVGIAAAIGMAISV